MPLRYTLLLLFSLGSFAVQGQALAPPTRLDAQPTSRPITPRPPAQLAQPGATISLAPALPVTAHQRLTIQLQAKTAPAPALADQLLRAAGAAALAYGQNPQLPMSLPERANTSRWRMPYLGAGVALALTPELRPHQSAAPAYLLYRFYNADSVLVAAQRQLLTGRARRGGQTLTLTTALPADGYVEVEFVNERLAPVQLTNLRVLLTETTPKRPFKGQIAEVFGAQRDGVCLGPVVVTSPPYCQVYPQYCQGPPPPFPPMDWPPYNPTPPTGPPPTNPGDGGDGGGSGSGGPGSSLPNPIPVVGNPLITPQFLNNACDGMTAALTLQNTYRREVEGFMLANGTVILLPMQNSTEFHSIIQWPIDDSDGHRLMPAPYQDATGAWFIDVSTWTNGVRNGPTTHAIISQFHTHPNTSSNPNAVSVDDINLATNTYPGMTLNIVTNNSIVNYNASGPISISQNICHP